MAGLFDFLGDVGGGALGQRSIPGRESISTGDLISGMGSAVDPLADINIRWNNRLGPAYARTANAVEDIYNPLQRTLRGSTTKSILDELGLGGNISKEDSDRVIREALQGNVASGFGASPGGRGLVARDLGLRELDVKNNRMDRAANFLAQNPKGYQLYQPQTITDPNDVADLMLGNSNAANSYNTFASLLKSQNNKNASGSILNMAGSIFGGMGGMGGGGGGIEKSGGIMNIFGGGRPTGIPAGTVGADEWAAASAGEGGGPAMALGGGGGGGDMFGGMFSGAAGGIGPMGYASMPGYLATDAQAIDEGNYGSGIGGLAGTAVGGYYGMPGLGQAVGSGAGSLLDAWFS